MTKRSERLLAAGGLAWIGWKLLQSARQRPLRGSVVLITGGSRGLGLLLAREFARHGCRLAICARDDRELAAAAEDLEGRGAEVLTVRCDVASRGEVQDMVRRVESHYGRVDVLVNNAGVIQMGPFSSMDAAAFASALDIMFWGPVHATEAVLPGMRRAGRGRIVNITSIGGYVSVPHLLPYNCAKFALAGYSEGLAAELAREGIGITTVVPGLMRTGSPVNALFRGRRDREWTWFALASATPLTTMSAERAARRIVTAVRRGETSLTLTWQANLLRTFHGAFPGTTIRLFAALNRLLPEAGEGEGRQDVPGMSLNTMLAPSPITALMNRAAIETHQYEGRVSPAPAHARSVGINGATRTRSAGRAG